ncbi:MAG: copper-binding protein [Nitrosopumilus sp.]|nr:copper-binding protein [Nitrosopumilus sp.]MDC4231817.1 plastocyanin/azurin family copper-binding protein [Nitrosopumilus sp.]
MAGIDKIAIAFTIAIIAIGVGTASYLGAVQDAGPVVSAPVVSQTQTDPFADIADEVKSGAPAKAMKAGWDRLTSDIDPGVGHESHQLAIILAPSDKVYSGTLKYDASESIQLVTLHGPLAHGEDKGQAIWTPDGKTKFALTFVDPKNAKGEWEFAGNALAVHTMNTEPFVVDYKVDYTEKSMSDTVMTGTVMSATDPGIGHESHQLAVLLAPSSDVYSGILSYSASENIQLVTLRGPISADEKPAKTWTPDGETIFELTFVDPKNAMGSWKFSGNALAVHTMKTNQATISYSVSATATAGKTIEVEDKVIIEESTMEEATTVEESTEPQTHMVDIPVGTSVPGCEDSNSCYSPADITINAGDTVEWINIDTAAHTVTGGSASDGPSGVFDSSLVMASANYAFTFNDAGSYDYYCMVHPWMTGSVTVN